MNNKTFAESFNASVTINPSLTLTIPTSTITSTLNPSTNTYSEQDLTISIGTNNTYGYKLYLSSIDSGTSTNNTNLVNTVDSTKTIPNITNNTYSIEDLPANTWGIRITNNSTTSSGDYGPLTQNTIISESNIPINNHTATLGLATKIDYTNPTGTYETTLSFKALPIVTTYTMQELGNNSTLASNICVSDSPTMIMDSRDGQIYSIQKLADGNCWMTQNLKLGKYSESMTLTNMDTDINTATFILDNRRTEDMSPVAPDSGDHSYDGSAYLCSDEYGCYYNWYTANGGSGTSSIITGTVNYSICSIGWTLATTLQYQTLVNAYGGTGATAALSMLVSPTSATENINGVYSPGFVLGGNYGGVKANINSLGSYWSHNAKSAVEAYYLGIRTSELLLPTTSGGGYGNKHVLRAVRCILK